MMNFSPFGNHFATAIPSIHQFAAKFTHDGTTTTTTTGNQQSMPVKYQRDSSTQISGNILPSTPNQSKYQSEPQHFPNLQLNYNGHLRQEEPPKRTGNYEENNMQQEICNLVKREEKNENGDYTANVQPQPGMPPSWQSIATPGSTVADYLSHLPASTLPISLHHFLKYSAETMKKDIEPEHPHPPPTAPQPDLKKKKKKKAPKEKKPRPKPGEIRLTTALDGSTLYCCPECHMAYPDKSLLEQHLLGHTMERRFFCEICGAGLKRKDHLTRHKQSHNPDRPFVCTVCMKAFKRKEQLTLHFVIHSGEKRHVCTECGKGFYRKDHLRKHTRSHIARRVKAEISQHVPTNHSSSERDPVS
ncbi:replication initiator 1-like isoform X2 [Cimex lectularius]|uniref:C2H2-type domain-containing protein n=1 Tax=Cimex lectularius TaxID=79782 RepID=A0A8I6RND0_CIMLE|nr:replication initiator 1-like isoform X2 [Cimex lectularius]